MKRIFLFILAAALMLTQTACFGAKSSVIDLAGSVTLARSGKTLAASNGLAVKEKDAFRAEEGSDLLLRLDEFKTVLLGGSGGVTAVSLGKHTVLAVEPGSLLVRVDKPLDEDESFDISLGALTISVKSSAVFSLHTSAAGQSILSVFQGSVHVYGQDGSDLVTLSKGLCAELDSTAGTLTGEARPIDYAELPALIADHVRDYAGEVDAAEETTPSMPQNTVFEQIVPEDTEPTATETDAAESTAPAATQTDGAESAVAAATQTDAGEPAPPLSEGGAQPVTPSDAFPTPPAVAFRYKWNGTVFAPYADITWTTPEAGTILWQLCDEQGTAQQANGRFDSAGGEVVVTDYCFDVASPKGGPLYPMGYTLRLTPYRAATGDGDGQALPVIVMELPYFEVEAYRDGEQTVPIVSTNVGFYFAHSHDSLTQSVSDGRVRVTGSLLPLEGPQAPLLIDAAS